jgi:succinate dehydrogenase flavin-adding protein (antitoxin of CptAB toxin-antitoxin module)
MVGYIAGNATPHGNAGVVRSLTYNPNVSSVRGYIPEDVDKTKLQSSSLLSPTEMLSAFTSTQADPTRQAMQIGQTKHTMPVVKTHKQLIGSGVNKTMAYMISDDFAFKAKKDGFIEVIDLENNLAILAYNDGTKDAIDLSEVFVKNSNSGFYIKQKFLITYATGEKFKKGDVIAYNPSFFSGKGNSVDYQPGTLAKIAIAAGDFAYEDSTIISDSLSEKAASYVTMVKQAALGPNTIVNKIATVGKEIKTGESLLEFTTSFADPSTTDFIARLTQSLGDTDADFLSNETITSKYTGKLVNIKIYYNKPVEELHESLQRLIKKYKGQIEKRKRVLGNVKTESVHIPPLEQQSSRKVGTQEYDGVLIEFYVEYYDEMSEGDKLTYSTALKGIISKRLSNDEAPISEHREDEVIEAIVTPTGIISRMTADIYSMLYGNKVLVELGKQIKEIMEDKR